MHSRAISRRQVLSALAAAPLAGCQQLNGSGTPGATETPTRQLTEPSGSADGTEGTIDVWTDYVGEAWYDKWENDVVPGWESQSEVPLSVEYPAWRVPESLREAVGEATPPELYHCEISQVADLVARGATREVDGLVSDLVAANGDLVRERPIRADGTAHVVPHGLTLGSVLNYRTDVYEALGLSVPETWDELVANARAIDEAESVDARGFAVAAGDPRSDEKAGMDLRTWLANAGGGVWQWADRDRGTVELDFRPADVSACLELLRNLAEASPEPAGLGYSGSTVAWIRGNVAQCLFPNALLAGSAHVSGPERVAVNTGVGLPPLRERRIDPVDRGWATVDGTPVFREADTPDAAEEFLRYMYEGPARQADKNLVRPMQYLPPYEGVLDHDAYRDASVFQALDGHLYDLNRQLVDEIAPRLAGDRPRTAATWYARNGSILSELVRAVVVEGKSIDGEIQRARSRLAARLAEGRELAAQ